MIESLGIAASAESNSMKEASHSKVIRIGIIEGTSELTAKDIFETLGNCVKVYFDDELYYDDCGEKEVNNLSEIFNKIVSGYFVQVTEFHHSVVWMY